MSDIVLGDPSGNVRVRFLAPNVVRITRAAPGAAGFPPDRPWLRHVLLPQPTTPPDESTLRVLLEGGCVRVLGPDGAALVRETEAPVSDRGSVRLSLSVEPGEGLYGGGEWFNAFRRERGTLRLETKESQAWNQRRQTYSNIPVFLSSRGYGLFLLNSHRSEWRIDRRRGVLEVAADGPPLDYLVIHGPAFREIVGTYTALTGRPPLLPRWALGLWVTGYPQEPQGVVLERVEEHRRRGIPLDGVILDYHWEAGFHTFRWRRSLFPDPDAMIARLREMGVRLGLIFTPFVNNRNHPLQRRALHMLFRNVASGEMRSDERALERYAEAKKGGYLAHDSAWWWLGSGGMVDFTNPAAAAWWNEGLRPLYDQGVVLFKNDDGEYLPRNARSHLGMDGREYHNIYGFFYGRAIYDGMKDLDDRRPMIYARSVWAGSQRYPAIFLGDQWPTFPHIKATMRAGLNMGLLGFAYWTADVFGLDHKTTRETHMRYAQWALMAPVARYFWRPPAIDDTRLPWSHGEQAEENFRRYARLRYRLLPYYCALGWEAYRTGLPIMRPLLLEFQDDPRLAGVADQVLLGDRLLLAPVVRARARRRRILLPKGTWHDFWSAKSYKGGGAITYGAPLDRLPILVRGGSIVPMGPELDSIPDGHRFDRLWLHCYPPYPAATTLFDDDGCSRAYERGAYSATPLRVEGDGRHVVVRVGAAEGFFEGQPAVRRVEVVLHRAGPPAEVRVAGAAADGWRYDADAQQLAVPVDCPSDAETVVEIDWRR